MFTRVSHFLAWINTTILSNGGLDSCHFSLIAPPIQGNTFESRKGSPNIFEEKNWQGLLLPPELQKRQSIVEVITLRVAQIVQK